MMPVLSPNTQAILLLTAPLIAGRSTASSDLLSPAEYKRLARHLREIQHQPADLLSPDAAQILLACQPVIDEGRLQKLLGRGFLLSQAIERWQARAIWVVSCADPEYPRRLKTRLHEDAPAVLYGCGDMKLLETGGLAVVGSSHVDDALIDYTISIVRLTASARKTLVSGGAKGIDQAAMRGAFEAGGKVCGVLADSLEKTTMNREHRNLLLDGQLVLISPYDPSAGFNVGNAMQRNKLIYALADTSLVVSSDLNSDFNKGGTWAGAVEPSAGLDGLRKKGALPWPNPQDGAVSDSQRPVTASEELPPVITEAVAPIDEAKEHSQLGSTPAEQLFAAVRAAIQQILSAPMKDTEVADALEVSKAQAKAWLQRLVDEGVLEKQKKPAGYIIKQKRLI